MKNIDDIIINEDTLVKEALEIIDKSSKQICLVLGKNRKLLGTLNDGDIRRALLNNTSLNESVQNVYFKNPTVANIDDGKEHIIDICTSKKIHQIPIVDDAGNLLGLEILDDLISKQSKSNKVVLMVGGLGTRLRPLTNDTPKPMLMVGNQPILETIISNFKKYGFTNIILCVSYKAEQIISYFGNGTKFGVNIAYIHENKRMGTAGALSLIKEGLDEDFFVMNGDLLTNMNFGNMMDYHTRNSASATMGVREYEFQVPYGVVNVDGVDIKNIEEKPTYNFFVSGGIYILNPKVLKFIPKDTFFDMPTLFDRVIEERLKCVSFPIREYWLDVGRMEEFKKANVEYSEIFLNV